MNRVLHEGQPIHVEMPRPVEFRPPLRCAISHLTDNFRAQPLRQRDMGMKCELLLELKAAVIERRVHLNQTIAPQPNPQINHRRARKYLYISQMY
jgi:hypothetical protein